MKSRLLFPEVGRRVLTAFYQVYNTLGFGFLEKVYENALASKLRKNGHYVQQQVPVRVYFEGEVIGNYFADIVVDKCVIIEVKAADALHEAHEAQLINYLRATSIELGFLINFGEKPEFRRKVFTNDRKEAFHGKAV